MARPLNSVVAAVTLALSLALSNPASAAIIPPLKQPKWAELTPHQREVLAPLSAEWDKLESYRRKKWLGIVQRYPTLSVEEQQRLQRRMKAWASLSPEERKRAREQYKTLRKAPPEQRQTVKQRWREYENLPEAEKERLKQSSKPQPKSAARKDTQHVPAPIRKSTSAPAIPPLKDQPTAPASANSTAQ